MPATRFPAPGAASGSIQWNTYTITVIGSSSSNTITLSSGNTDSRWVGTTPVITSGTGQFAANTTITSVINSTSFTINNIPTVALSGATMTVSNGAMQVVTDNSRTVGTLRSAITVKTPTPNPNFYNVGKLRSALTVRNPARNDAIIYDVNYVKTFKWRANELNSNVKANTLSNFDNAYWTYFNNSNQIIVGTANPKLTNYHLISSKVIGSPNSTLTVDSPSSNIPYITNTNTYYGTFNSANSQNLTISSFTPVQAAPTSPFTIECWVNVTSFTGCVIATNIYGPSNIPYAIGFCNGADPGVIGPYPYFASYNGAVWSTFLASPNATGTNTWYHFAASYDRITLRLFINGTVVASTTSVSLQTSTATAGFYIGRRWDAAGSTYFTGNISNFRFVKNLAVYIGNFVPLGPLSIVQVARQNVSALNGNETVLLALQSNSALIDSSGNYSITNSATPVTVTQSSALGTIPNINDYVLITDLTTRYQSLAQINAVTSTASPSYTLTVPTSSLSNLGVANTWLIQLWEADILTQENIRTNRAAINPRENLYYSKVIPTRYGSVFQNTTSFAGSANNISLNNIDKVRGGILVNPTPNEPLYYKANNLQKSISVLRDIPGPNKFDTNNINSYKLTIPNQTFFTPLTDYLQKQIASLRDISIENKLSVTNVDKSKFLSNNNQIFFSPISNRLEVIIAQTSVRTNLPPTLPRENLYYAQLVNGNRYGVQNAIQNAIAADTTLRPGKAGYKWQRNQLFNSPVLTKVDATILQSTVSTNRAPANPREVLFYSNLAKGKYGVYFPSLTASTDSNSRLNVNKVDATILQSTVSTTRAPTNARENLYYANLAKGKYGVYFPSLTASTDGNSRLNVNKVDATILQSTVSTNLPPTNARENLYYSTLVRGRYGSNNLSLSFNALPDNLNLSLLTKQYEIVKSPSQVPNNYRLSNFDAQYWTYTSNPNKITVGTANLKLTNYSTVSSKITSGGSIQLTVNNPSSTIPYITSGQTYYGYFNVATSGLVIAHNTALDLSIGNFTIEFWVYKSTNSIGEIILGKSGNASNAYLAYGVTFGVSNNLIFTTGDSTGASFTTNYTIGTITLNTWYHVAVVKIDTTIVTYLNGVQTSSQAQGTAIVDTGKELVIGNQYNALRSGLSTAGPIDTRLSNLRIVKGVVVYTGNFTPLGPLSTVQPARLNVSPLGGTETSLLTLQNTTPTVDNSVNNFTITNIGSISMTVSQALGIAPTINDFVLVTDTVTSNQGLGQITAAGSTNAASFQAPLGQALYTSSTSGGTYNSTTNTYTFTWVCPTNVFSVSAVAIGGGGGGAYPGTNALPATGGGGGALAWKNNIPVIPGNSYTVQVGAGGSSVITSNVLTTGGAGGTSYFIDPLIVAASGGAGGRTSGGTSIQLGQVLFEGNGNRSDGGTAGTYNAETNNYSFSWTVPNNVFSICVVCVGGGGGGAGGGYATGTGGGGGGLVWVNNITVVPGTIYNIRAGGGGARSNPIFFNDIGSGSGSGNNPGGDSWFNTSTYIVGKGGGAGNWGVSTLWNAYITANFSSTAAASVGGTFSNISGFTGGGGNGGAGRAATSLSYQGGGGGGAGGYSGTGGAGFAAAGAGGTAATAGTGGAGGGGGGGSGAGGSYNGTGSGGGVGVYGAGSNGAAGTTENGSTTSGSGGGGGSNGNNGSFSLYYALPGATGGGYGGGGGGGCAAYDTTGNGGAGGIGAVRIIWPATKKVDGSVVRAFAGTSAGNVLTTDQSSTISDTLPIVSMASAAGGTVLAGTGSSGGAGGQFVAGTSVIGAFASGGGGAGGYGTAGGAGGGAWGVGSSSAAAGAAANGGNGAGAGGGATGDGTVTASAGAGGGAGVVPTAISTSTAGSVATAGAAPTGGSAGNSGSAGGNGSTSISTAVSVGGAYGGGGGGLTNAAAGSLSAGQGASGAVRIMWPATKVQDGSAVRSYGATTGALLLAADQSGTIADVQPNISYTVSIPKSSVENLNTNNTWALSLWEADIYKKENVSPITNPTTPRDRLYYSQLAPGKYGQYFPSRSSQVLLPNNVNANTLSNFANQYWTYADNPNSIVVGTPGPRYTTITPSSTITTGNPNTTITGGVDSTTYGTRFVGTGTGVGSTSTYGYLTFTLASELNWNTTFCLEFWFYANNFGTQNSYNLINTGSINSFTSVTISPTGINFTNPGFTSFYTFPFTIATGQWYHIAIMGNPTNTWVALNGVSQNYAGVLGGINAGYSPTAAFGTSFSICGTNVFNAVVNNFSQDFYLANFRIVKGSTVYNTSGFNRPTVIPTNITGTQFLTLVSAGPLVDSSINNRPITAAVWNGTTTANIPTIAVLSGTPFFRIAPLNYIANDQLLITDTVTNYQALATVVSSNSINNVVVPTSQVSNLNPSNIWNLQLWESDIFQQLNVRTINTPILPRENLYYAQLAKGNRYRGYFPNKTEAAATDDLRNIGNINKGKILPSANSLALYYSPALDSLATISSQNWYQPSNNFKVIAGQASLKQTITAQTLSLDIGPTTSIISFKSTFVWNYYPQAGEHLLLTDNINGREAVAKIISISNNASLNVVIPLGHALMVGNGVTSGTGIDTVGSANNTYTYQWTCPDNVYSVCAVAVGSGGGGYPNYGSGGGGGGGLAWCNNIPVIPGVKYNITTGNAPSGSGGVTSSVTFGSINLTAFGGQGGAYGEVAGGGYSITGTSGITTQFGGGTGGNSGAAYGGQSGSGGGGAGGYAGNGGRGGNGNYNGTSAPWGDWGDRAVPGSGAGGGGGGSGTYGNGTGGGGGGVGLFGIGTDGGYAQTANRNGTPGLGGSSGSDGSMPNAGAYGGGGGGAGGVAGPGAVRIIWPALRIVDASQVRAFGNGTNVSNLLATDQTSVLNESLLVFTAVVATSEIANIISSQGCTVQPWDPSYIPQSLVKTQFSPTNPRENLYWTSLLKSRYGIMDNISRGSYDGTLIYNKTDGLLTKYQFAGAENGLADPSATSKIPVQFWN